MITFELYSINKFSVSFSANFNIPEEIVHILKRNGGAFDYNSPNKEWIVSLNKYKEVAIEISQFCRVKIIDLDPIP